MIEVTFVQLFMLVVASASLGACLGVSALALVMAGK